MTRDCRELTAACVHVMVDRARLFRADELQDEKMRSLGRLSAGLAHELNNPASAAARTAKSLCKSIADLDLAARAVGALGLSASQLSVLARTIDAAPVHAAGRSPSPIEGVDREDAVTDWLERRLRDTTRAGRVLDAGLDVGQLDALASALEPSALPAAIDYVAAARSARMLAGEIETAAARIHSLVGAVKRHTYMDRAMAPTPVDVARSLVDALTLLRSKAKARAVSLEHDIAPDLPAFDGFGGELNQVWSNLIDNAIDAAPQGGRVTVTAVRDQHSIVVRVTDDGQGIPQDIRDRIFDPFFTTKGVGEGTGLGLNLARSAVERHEGSIDIESAPGGGTTFTVTLPMAGAAATRPAEK
jgi:signal transduction histidine kinase